MVERVRRNLFRVILILAIIVIIVVAIVRKTEMTRLRHRIEDGSAHERMAAVHRLLEKDKLRDAMEDQPRWSQDHALTALAFMGDYHALDQILKIKMWLDAPVDARSNATIDQWDETACGPLVRALQDKDANTRAAAVAVAPGIPTEDTMIVLCMDLMDAWDQYVRDAVRDVMATAPMPTKTAPLLAKVLLEQKPGATDELTTAEYLRRRGTAIATLEKMAAPAIQPLAGLMSHTQPEYENTRAQVCISLGVVGANAGDADVLARAAKCAPILAKALDTDPSWTVKRQAALALGRLQPQDIVLDPPLDQDQINAIYETIPSLIQHLRDPESDVRAAAAVALGELRATEAASALGAVLADAQLRRGAGPEIGVAMGSIGDVCVPYLKPALDDPDPDVRELAARTLSTIGGAESVPLLLQRVDIRREPDVAVRRIAAEALRNITQSVRAAREAAESSREAAVPLAPLVTPLEDLKTAEDLAAKAIAKRRPGVERRQILANAAQTVAAQLASAQSLSDSAAAAYKAALGSMEPVQAAKRGAPYLAAARAQLLQTELAFPKACKDIKTPMVVQTKLAAQLRTVRIDYRSAVNAINDTAALSVAAKDAMPRLAAVLGDPDWHVYTSASDALADMGAAAVPDLIAAMRSHDARISYTAEQGVAAVGHAAVPPLVGHLDDPDQNLAMWAAVALGDIGTPAVDDLTAALQNVRSKPAQVRANAARALGLCRDIQATGMGQDVVTTLSQAAQHDPAPEVRVQAIRALASIRGTDATIAVIRCLRDPDASVADQAMDVLARWPAIHTMDLGKGKGLTDVLSGSDPKAAERAAIVLAAQFREGQVPGIELTRAGEQREHLRQQIANALQGDVESPGRATTLLRQAIEAYGAVGLAADATRLEQYLTPDPAKRELAKAACRALGSIGARASRIAMDKTRSGETPPGSEPAEILVKRLEDPEQQPMLGWYALALAEVRETAVQPVMKLFGKSQGDLRVWCAAIIGRIGKPAVNMLFDTRGGLAKQRRALVEQPGISPNSQQLKDIDERLRWYSVAMVATHDKLASDFVDNVREDEKPSIEMTRQVRDRMAEMARLKAEEWLAEESTS